jgi:hypothetical protein
MAFATDITLAGDASSSRIYSQTSQTEGNSIRKNSSAPLSLPESLTIKNGVSSRSGVPLDRHLVRLDLTKANAANVALMASVYVTFEVPRDVVFTAAIIKDMRTQLTNFLGTAGYVEKLLNGEP